MQAQEDCHPCPGFLDVASPAIATHAVNLDRCQSMEISLLGPNGVGGLFSGISGSDHYRGGNKSPPAWQASAQNV